MARRLPKVCERAGCQSRAEPGENKCPACQDTAYQRDKRRRGSASERGYNARHRKWRRMILHRDPLCVQCDREGRVRPARIADHILPVEEGGRWTLENGQGLCTPCHNRKTAAENQGVATWEGLETWGQDDPPT